MQAGVDAETGTEFGADTSSAIAMAVPTAPSSNATGMLGPARSAPAAAQKPAAATGAQAEALRNYISRKYKVAYDATGPLLNTVYRVGREKKLDPLLLLAVIAIESRYNPLAESHVGVQGLMQVMTSVHQDKFDAVGKNPLDPTANIMVGATILRDCINRRGSVDGGLACYVGSTGPDDNGHGQGAGRAPPSGLGVGIALARLILQARTRNRGSAEGHEYRDLLAERPWHHCRAGLHQFRRVVQAPGTQRGSQ